MEHTTPPPASPSRTFRLRGVFAVAAGLLAIILLSTATDALLHAAEVYPPPRQMMSDELFGVALTYRVVYGVAGSWLTARLAPDRPMQHALVLGFVGLVISTMGAVAMWDLGPPWYSLAVIGIALPSAWLGGWIRVRQLRTAESG
jgi:hypothetical protein